MTSLRARVHLPRRRPVPPPPPACTARAYEEIAAELPEEDLGEDLAESLDLYVMGSKPRCEEAEYLDLVQDAVDRIAREG